jgi:hypothetical protein
LGVFLSPVFLVKGRVEIFPPHTSGKILPDLDNGTKITMGYGVKRFTAFAISAL